MRVRQFPDAPNRNMERVVVEMPINNGEIKCHLHVERAFQTRLKKAPKNRSWCFFSLSAHGRCSSSSSDALGSALESCLARVCAGLSACLSRFCCSCRLLLTLQHGVRQSCCHRSNGSPATETAAITLTLCTKTQAHSTPHQGMLVSGTVQTVK